METYETFKASNANWGGYGFASEKDMQENYQIALRVEQTYKETFCNTEEPRVGDTVEFSDGFRVYKHGKIAENLYGGSEHGMLCICESGTSHTNGKFFSTSGGAFLHKHKSLLKLVGEDENLVWTWGCHGAGANQGIYFTLKVRKWIIPYGSIQKASRVYIRVKNKNDRYPVLIENFGNLGWGECFSSVKAFRAWADYVGFVSKPYNGTFDRISPQRISRKYIWNQSEVPEGAKPLKLIDNGRCVDSFVVSDAHNIVYYVFNTNALPKEPKYGTKEYEEKLKEHWKYSGNPLGV